MKKGLIILTLSAVVCALSIGLIGYDNKDNSLRQTVEDYGQVYVVVNAADVSSFERLFELFSVSNVYEGNVEIALSPSTVELFIAQGYNYSVVDDASSKAIVTMAESVAEAMEWQSYPTYMQYETIMNKFASDFPSICSIDTIGYSVKGKLLLAAKISDNVQIDESEPEVFYSSTMHGDEIGGYVVMLRFIDYLLKNYDTDEYVKHLVNELEIYVNPLANPDGTYVNDSIITYPTRSNSNDYDLNRNFPRVSGGSSASLQPETACMINFMNSRRFSLSANLHHGVEVVNYPWDTWSRRHPDDDWFCNVSRRYADTAHAYSLTPYMTYKENGVTNGYDWYSTTGSRQDYVTYFLRGREVTIEIDDTKQTAASNLDSLWIRNRKSLLDYVENALFGITGIICDSLTNEPLSAKIFVVDHDKDSSYVYSDTISGVFRRLIYPGSYRIKVSKDGYIDKYVDVVVVERQLVNINVQMVPVGYIPEDPVSSELVFEDSIVVYPNPLKFGEKLTVFIPDKMSGFVNVEIYDMVGRKQFDYEVVISQRELVVPEVSNMPYGVYILVLKNKDTGVAKTFKIVIN